LDIPAMLFRRHYFAILDTFSFVIKIFFLKNTHTNYDGDGDNAFLED
jgi:hypothetical protein